MKYIMLDEKIPIIFPEHLHHKDVAEAFGALLGTDVTSAGHVQFVMNRDGYIKIDGKSNGLDMYPSKNDYNILDIENEKPNES